MKKSRSAIACLAAASLLALLPSCNSAPQVPTAVKGNPFIQKLPKGGVQVVGAGLPPEQLAPGTEFAQSAASLRAVIRGGRLEFGYREVSYVAPGRTRDYPGLSREFLEQQAALGGLRVVLPPKKGVQYFFSPQYIRSFLTDVETALITPLQ